MKQGLSSSILSTLLFSSIAFADIYQYAGTLGNNPVQFVLNSNDFESMAIYRDNNTKVTNLLIGETKHESNGNDFYIKLIFYNENGTMTFPHFNADSPTLLGSWQKDGTGITFPIELKRTATSQDNWYTNTPLLINGTTDLHYFKILVSKKNNDIIPNTLQIYEKDTNKLIQEIPDFGDDYFMFIKTIHSGDYNFDSHTDFSIIAERYNHNNIRSNYYLWNPVTHKYDKSKITGASLEFDHEQQLIYDIKRSSTATEKQVKTYKLNNNDEMILIDKNCLQMNHEVEKMSFIEVSCDDFFIF